MTIGLTKLLGFDTVGQELSAGIDPQDNSLGDKLGAKIGPPEEFAPAKCIDFQNRQARCEDGTGGTRYL